MSYSIVLTTCPDMNEANSLALKIINEKLAACIQLSAITSIYTWKGSLHQEPEIRLLMKTKSGLYKALEEFILKHHSYEVPEIVLIPITQGSDEYLDWIDRHTC